MPTAESQPIYRRHIERTAQLEAIATCQTMRVIAIGESRVAMIDGNSTIYLYQIDVRYLARQSWTPGPCLATLTQEASEEAEFEQMGKALVN